MLLIPVLDLMRGQVVHARAGRRDEYLPLVSALCRSSRPEAVLEALLALHPFRRVYIADLDAIQGKGDHRAVLEALRRAHPQLEFWVDAGFSGMEEVRAWQAGGLGRPVLGSESLKQHPGQALCAAAGVLSLDFRGDGFMGPPGLPEDVGCWPDDVIVMTLGRVGMGEGPDVERLARLKALGGHSRLHAAGGVRHAGDLEALAQAGAAGVLLASALHQGVFSPTELAAFHDPHPTHAAIAAMGSAPGPDR